MVFILLLCLFTLLGNGVFGAGHTTDRIRAITYNTALQDLPITPSLLGNNRLERLQRIIDAIRSSEADIVCLQEVWIGNDLEIILDQLDDVYRFSYSPLHDRFGNLPSIANVEGEAPCPRQLLVDLADCTISSGCSSPNVTEELSCSAVNCIAQLGALFLQGQECLSCVGVSGETPELGIERCSSATPTTSNPRIMNTNGLALLAKRPLSNLESHKFYDVTTLVDRGYISAMYDGKLNVVCTHLTAVLPGLSEPFLSGTFPTYVEQNKYEVDVLTARYGRLSPLVLLGDMNNGDAFTVAISSTLPKTYQKMRQAFDTTVPPRYCTFCAVDRNPYNVVYKPESIDHIFGNGIKIAGAKAITFNTALFDLPVEPSLPFNNRLERLQGTIEAIRSSTADIVCLQEVWIGNDLEIILDQLDDVYSFNFSPLHDQFGNLPSIANVEGEAPCPRQVLEDLAACSISTGCTTSDIREELACTSIRCPAQLGAVFLQGQECVSCVGQSAETPQLGVERCSSATPTTSNPRVMNGNGLALLSKRPLSNLDSYRFYNVTTLIEKGYISAVYDGKLNVICTHLTAALSGISEPFLSETFPTYADQNIYEVDLLTTKYGRLSPLLLLGDMNNGDAFTTAITPSLPKSYQKMRKAFDTTVPPRYCTFCAIDRNPYNVDSNPVSIDHIFGNGIKVVGAKVIFKVEDVNVTDSLGNRFPLSDHYGFEAVFDYPCFKRDVLLH